MLFYIGQIRITTDALEIIDNHHVCGPSGRSAGSEDEIFVPEMKNMVLSVCFSVAVSPRGHSGVPRVKYTKRLLVGVIWVLISIGNFLARPEPAKNPWDAGPGHDRSWRPPCS